VVTLPISLTIFNFTPNILGRAGSLSFLNCKWGWSLNR
jgi:hypothetical protein